MASDQLCTQARRICKNAYTADAVKYKDNVDRGLYVTAIHIGVDEYGEVALCGVLLPRRVRTAPQDLTDYGLCKRCIEVLQQNRREA